MPDGKPNILVIWGDDIGMWNVGAYTHMRRRRQIPEFRARQA